MGVPLWRGDGGAPDAAAEVVASSVEPQVVLVAPCWPPATGSVGVTVQAWVHDHLRQMEIDKAKSEPRQRNRSDRRVHDGRIERE